MARKLAITFTFFISLFAFYMICLNISAMKNSQCWCFSVGFLVWVQRCHSQIVPIWWCNTFSLPQNCQILLCHILLCNIYKWIKLHNSLLHHSTPSHMEDDTRYTKKNRVLENIGSGKNSTSFWCSAFYGIYLMDLSELLYTVSHECWAFLFPEAFHGESILTSLISTHLIMSICILAMAWSCSSLINLACLWGCTYFIITLHSFLRQLWQNFTYYYCSSLTMLLLASSVSSNSSLKDWKLYDFLNQHTNVGVSSSYSIPRALPWSLN